MFSFIYMVVPYLFADRSYHFYIPINLVQSHSPHHLSQQYNMNSSFKNDNQSDAMDIQTKREEEESLQRYDDRMQPQSMSLSAPSNQADEQQAKQFKTQNYPIDQKLIDLDKLLLSDIVRYCREQKLIKNEVAHSFLANYGVNTAKQYLEALKNSTLNNYNYEKCKIQIIDHRRLTEMLVNHNPSKYMPATNPYDYLKEIKLYLDEIYSQTSDEYYSTLHFHSKQFGLFWWGAEYLKRRAEPSRINLTQEPTVKKKQVEVEPDELELSRPPNIPADLYKIANSLSQKILNRPLGVLKQPKRKNTSRNQSGNSEISQVKLQQQRERSRDQSKKSRHEQKMKIDDNYETKIEDEAGVSGGYQLRKRTKKE